MSSAKTRADRGGGSAPVPRARLRWRRRHAIMKEARRTHGGVYGHFVQSQILQALGQSFALTALVFLIAQSINPGDALTIGALLKTSRLFGGDIGSAFMQTFVRQREQIHSNLIGLHVDAPAELTTTRLQAYRSAVGTHTSDLAIATAQAANLLASAIAKQAAVLAYIDGFIAAAPGTFVCLLLTAILPPNSAGGRLRARLQISRL